ncbi:Mitochondrial intermembrane space import and assembly protein 40 [Neolecta irregularis DAH-3]|uniref:Mitochondrial intermembrane space import and assembly protein 40 n=1 Tax=Neolecta irregularis (strain DAH-3) TaxID=1198029 RepID=A0A1U7LHJ5_NEOID|nr:Mitochondrial intermembrane space import and assembly protein 40 [Neolecta irregularis DAH-3]|eukprot:OLL22130.1 Mitochondrial intermembrane space import and assembly protein 40 [Neolecta irregularis DAH-3]
MFRTSLRKSSSASMSKIIRMSHSATTASPTRSKFLTFVALTTLAVSYQLYSAAPIRLDAKDQGVSHPVKPIASKASTLAQKRSGPEASTTKDPASKSRSDREKSQEASKGDEPIKKAQDHTANETGQNSGNASNKKDVISQEQPQQGLGQEDEGQDGAYNEVTGEINWDCPCLGGMAHGPCGEEFKEAFSCFVYSKTEPKGSECIEKFKSMQDCFKEHPDIYSDQFDDDNAEEQSKDEMETFEHPAEKEDAMPNQPTTKAQSKEEKRQPKDNKSGTSKSEKMTQRRGPTSSDPGSQEELDNKQIKTMPEESSAAKKVSKSKN